MRLGLKDHKIMEDIGDQYYNTDEDKPELD